LALRETLSACVRSTEENVSCLTAYLLLTLLKNPSIDRRVLERCGFLPFRFFRAQRILVRASLRFPPAPLP
jgi:hypothetical protein